MEAGSIQAANVRMFCEENAGSLLVIDVVDERSESLVSALIRAASEVRSAPPRLLLLPTDSATAFRLKRSLVGQVSSLEVVPIQPDEGVEEGLVQSEAIGPLADVAADLSAPSKQKWDLHEHWLRGGLPQSLLAEDGRASYAWRRAYLEALQCCDLRPWDIEAGDQPFEILRWLANSNGQQFDVNRCAVALSMPKNRVRSVIKALRDIGLVRLLPNWPAGSNDSMGEYPVPYLRDSGLLHALIEIRDRSELEEHRLYGHSWEGFAIEALLSAAGSEAVGSYYRDNRKDEIDLVLTFSSRGPVCAIEFKTNPERSVEPGFWRASERISATERLVVHTGDASVFRGGDLESAPLLSAINRIRAISNSFSA
ncbi:DUF4143 domain-containing protein [Methylorubrum populi]|uniref:DUF4143 domain-containing protein n=1 Tax=Methylorubrum populi TaxID=223967 RepID=UPI001648ACD0|nr:DUF4143 domain-containing protein [Methylorubrum populi]